MDALRVLARSNDPDRAVLVEKYIDTYLTTETVSVWQALERLCKGIRDEQQHATFRLITAKILRRLRIARHFTRFSNSGSLAMLKQRCFDTAPRICGTSLRCALADIANSVARPVNIRTVAGFSSARLPCLALRRSARRPLFA